MTKFQTGLFSLLALLAFLAATPAMAQSYYQNPPQNYQGGYGYSAPCIALNTVLYSGLTDAMTGGQVSVLQTTLISRGYLVQGTVSGYFGTATTQAVKKFQKSSGIPVNGVVGQATRAALNANRCSPNPPYPQQVSLTSITPQAGAAGTSITLYGSGFEDYNTVYIGTVPVYSSGTGNLLTVVVPQDIRAGTYQVYVKNTRGTSNSLLYTVTGSQNCYFGYGYPGCYPCGNDLSQNCCQSYNSYYCYPGAVSIVSLAPSAGAVGSTVTVYGSGFSPTGNTVRFGNGLIANVSSQDGRSLTFVVPSQLSGYGSPYVTEGAYQLSVLNAQGLVSNSITFTVTNIGNANSAPVIKAISGPTTLNVHREGTWSATVQGGNSGNPPYISVSVQWGDENASPYQMQPIQNVYAYGEQSVSFTHTYYAPGIYTVRFTAVAGNGMSNSATMTVVVTGQNAAPPAITSLSPPSGRVGQQILIQGSGFTGAHTVYFGAGGQRNVYATGNGIYFTIPQYISPCDVSEPYSYCALYMQQVTAGTYPIYVKNANGTSNTLYFTVL